MANYYAPYSLRVSEELLYKVRHIAKANKRSANKQIEFILELFVSDWETRNPPIEVPPV